MIVDPGGGDVGMTEPFLDFGDVGLMVEGVSGGRRAQPVRTDLEPELCGIGPDEGINAVRRDGFVELAIAPVADRAEQGAVLVGAVAGGLEVIVNESVGARVEGQIPGLVTLAGDREMQDAPPRVAKILDLQLAQFKSRRSAWNSSVDRMARSRLCLMVSSPGVASSSRA
jgi:hypothetical protein